MATELDNNKTMVELFSHPQPKRENISLYYTFYRPKDSNEQCHPKLPIVEKRPKDMG